MKRKREGSPKKVSSKASRHKSKALKAYMAVRPYEVPYEKANNNLQDSLNYFMTQDIHETSGD